MADINNELSAKLRNSTFAAFDAVIDLAVDRQVDFVVIAGDVFDSAARSLRAQLRFSDGLCKLSEAGIDAYIARGNHDPAGSWTAAVTYPESAHFFGTETVEVFPLTRRGVCVAKIYGIGYARQNTTENLARKFRREDDLPAIGVLHCTIGENTGHAPYASASPDDLIRGNMDYWALGHVHGRAILRPERPAIVYSGNSQGRHPKETGEKGCCHVTMDTTRRVTIEFCPVDTVRFHTVAIDVSPYSTLTEVIEAAAGECLAFAAGQSGRDVIARVVFIGRTNLKAHLSDERIASDLLPALRDRLVGPDPIVWVESIECAVSGFHDLDALRRRGTIITEVIAAHDRLDETEIDGILGPVIDGWPGARFIDPLSSAEKSILAEEALNRVLDAFSGGDES